MKVVLLGSGNVATHLAKAFEEGGQELVQVWSRELEHAKLLTDGRKAAAVSDLSAIDCNADLYVISVKDESIAEVSDGLKGIKGLVVHTSGSTSMTVLKNAHKAYGVLYPLQTFSKNTELNFETVPLCLEAVDGETLEKLKTVAGTLSDTVYEVNSEQRKVLHLAAVFACNFTNHLYHISQQLLQSHGLDFDLLKPLIRETAHKIHDAIPRDVQTGPAIRDDQTIINTHLNMLEDYPDLQDIYTILSRSIKKTRE